MHCGSVKSWAIGVLSVVLLGAFWIVPFATIAQGELCDGAVEIVNGGFESPTVAPPRSVTKVPPGWVGADFVSIFPPSASEFASGSQFVFLAKYGTSISQQLSVRDLAGATIAFSVISIGSGSISFDGVTQDIVESTGSGQTTFHTYSVPADQVFPLILTLSDSGNKGFSVDSITGTYPKPCSTPTVAPSPLPTSTPTETPSEDVELTVTGDPRFPVDGSAALETSGLTYSLADGPDQGSVDVRQDGTFAYTADSYLVTFDRFAVLASNNSVITVNVVLEIDKSIPTDGEVKPG